MVGRGEVWWADLADVGRRPVLVLTREEVVDALTSVLVATITTRRRDIPTEVALDADDGMPQPCVVSLDNLATERKAHLMQRITRLGPEKMHEVCRALARATGCG